MIGIRVDANKEVATGHLMRCLSIASEFKERNIEVIFLSAENNIKQIVEDNNLLFYCLNSWWNNMDCEIEDMIYCIQKYKIEKLIVDSYFVTDRYVEELSCYTKIIYIDDLGRVHFPVSMVINYNIYYESFHYNENFHNAKVKLLLGCDYTPLRKEFQSVKNECDEKVRNVLITTGGADIFNVAGKFLKRLRGYKKFNDITFHIVVGKLNDNIEELTLLAQVESNIVLHRNVSNMADLMTGSDIALTAGGITLYELCACGTPAIMLSFADNQLFAVDEFQKLGIMEYAGDFRENENDCIEKMAYYLNLYRENYNLRKEKSNRMKKIVDGQGVKRIADSITVL